MKITVAGKSVLQQGVVVCHSNDAISIRPFDDDHAFEVRIAIDWDEKTENSLALVGLDAPEKGCAIKFTQSKNSNQFSNRTPVIFAISDDSREKYLINIAISVIGNQPHATFIIAFTIMSENI
jgi:hypothetical protein